VTATVIGQVIQFTLQARSSDWAGLFDHLEVWRSTLGEDGPYTEMTAVAWQGPTIPADLYGQSPPLAPVTGAQVAISGLQLQLLFNEETPVNVNFTGTNPLTFHQAAVAISAQGDNFVSAFVWTDGRMVLVGAQPGNKAIMRVVGGDAAPLLGLTTSGVTATAYGKDSRIELIAGQDAYSFTDYHGDSSYWYKTRFHQALSNNVSDFSLPFSTDSGSIVNPASVIVGTIDLVDAQGKPIENREVSIYTRFGGNTVGAFGVIPRDIRQLTDVDGHAEFQLLRGLQVTVSVAGTQLVRDITVPADPTLSSFGLLDPGIGSNDVFTVQVPEVDFVVRRSL
jgi:hypothetical protein